MVLAMFTFIGTSFGLTHYFDLTDESAFASNVRFAIFIVGLFAIYLTDGVERA